MLGECQRAEKREADDETQSGIASTEAERRIPRGATPTKRALPKILGGCSPPRDGNSITKAVPYSEAAVPLPEDWQQTRGGSTAINGRNSVASSGRITVGTWI